MAEFVLIPAASRQWWKLTPQTRARLEAKLKDFAETGQGDVKKLKGFKNKYRLRVGDYRVLFELEKDIISVYAFGHRREIYR